MIQSMLLCTFRRRQCVGGERCHRVSLVYMSAESVDVHGAPPVLRAEGQSGHQNVCDEGHGGDVEIGSVHVNARSHGGVLLVVNLPVLQHTHEHTLSNRKNVTVSQVKGSEFPT